MKKILITLSVLLSTMYAKNLGIDANSCIETRANGSVITLRNSCSEHIFVFYCGQLADSSKCGDMGPGTFYTQAENMKGNSEITFEVDKGGIYFYGACFGAMSNGKIGAYEDFVDGRYRCVRE